MFLLELFVVIYCFKKKKLFHLKSNYIKSPQRIYVLVIQILISLVKEHYLVEVDR
jgi:hypothetical protein